MSEAKGGLYFDVTRNTVIQLPHKNGQSSLSLLLRDIKVQPKGELYRDILLYKDILLYTNRQSSPFHVIHWWRAYHVRLTKLDCPDPLHGPPQEPHEFTHSRKKIIPVTF